MIIETEKIVRECIESTILIDVDDLKDTNLEELIKDELDCIEFIMHLEDEFDVQIDEDKVKQFTTIAELCKYIDSIPKGV